MHTAEVTAKHNKKHEAQLYQLDIVAEKLMDSDGEIAREWLVIGIPATYILDASGRIAYTATGIREWDNDLIVSKILELTHTP